MTDNKRDITGGVTPAMLETLRNDPSESVLAFVFHEGGISATQLLGTESIMSGCATLLFDYADTYLTRAIESLEEFSEVEDVIIHPESDTAH